MTKTNRINTLGELVTFPNTKGWLLDGILYEVKDSKKTIIHVHGSYGNFYQAYFPRVMAKFYTAAGYNFLCFNLTCHDGFGEGYRNDEGFDYMGGAISEFSTCVRDIEGAVQFVSGFSDEIILQGHSLGCDRVVHYLLTSNRNFNFILLAPCNSHKLQSNWLSGKESVEEQIKRLEVNYDILKDFDWLPIKEYGVYSSGEDYILPITRKALLSIITGPPFQLFNVDNPTDYFLEQNCFVYIGGKDKLQTDTPETMCEYFEKRVANVKLSFVPGGDHMLAGQEETLALGIISWLKNQVMICQEKN